MENNYCRFWTFSDLPLLPMINATCKLLSDCAPHRVASGFPFEIIKSGNRYCPPKGRIGLSCCPSGQVCIGQQLIFFSI